MQWTNHSFFWICPSTATLKRIWNAWLHKCSSSLTQGHYTWWHNQVLKCLADVLETQRTRVNALPPSSDCWQPFGSVKVKPAAQQLIHRTAGQSMSLEAVGWPGQEAPSRVCSHQPVTRPCFLVSLPQHIFIIELTVPREGAVKKAYEWKKLEYAQLAADVQQQGWTAEVGPVEGNQGLCWKRKDPLNLLEVSGAYQQTTEAGGTHLTTQKVPSVNWEPNRYE